MNLFLFIKNSFVLDLRTTRSFPWNFNKKLEFITKKYIELIKLKTRAKKFKLGTSYIHLFEKILYYDSSFGLAVYQSMYGRLGKLIQEAGLKDVKTVVDIGANVGFFSLMINDLFPKSKIYAIEPIEETYKCLSNNIKDFKNIYPFQLAISKKNGSRYMRFDKEDSLISKFAEADIGKDIKKVKVKTKSLDDFCESKKLKTVDLLKIDVETFELDVLLGSKNTLAKTKYLLIEITIENNKNYTFSQLIKLLYSKNYNFQLVSFRNYSDKAEGFLPVGDFLFENIALAKR